MDTLAWMTIILGLVAALEDLCRGSISNWVNGSALAGGLLYHTVRGGGPGLLTAAGGAVLGFVIFLVCYLMGGMGGGDVKLMAAFGSLLGPPGILMAALLTAIIGGLLAILSMAFARNRKSIPYGPAIVLGSWLALLAGR